MTTTSTHVSSRIDAVSATAVPPGTAYAELSRDIRIADLLARRPGYYSWKIALTARQVGSAYRPLSQSLMPADGEMISVLNRVGGPDPEFEAVDRRLSLCPLLAGLPERDRHIIALRFIDELTQAEIGVMLGISQMHTFRYCWRDHWPCCAIR